MLVQFFFDSREKLVVGFVGGDVGVVGDNACGSLEQEARLARLYHAEVVVAVAACDSFAAAGLQRSDGGVL